MIAALAATMSSRAAELGEALRENGLDRGQVAGVGLPRDDPPVERLHLAHGLREVGLGRERVAQPVRGGARVERDDVAAFLRQPYRV
jgi:hypothetical protein